MSELLKDTVKLKDLLNYHLVPGKVSAADIVELKSVETAAGKSLRIEVAEDVVKINGVQVVKTDVECSNGIIHVIDEVLIPE